MAAPNDSRQYRVVMGGNILVSADRGEVVRKLARLFGVDRERIEAVLHGTPVIVKRSLEERRAHQYVRTIMNAGADCYLELDDPLSLASQHSEDAQTAPAHGLVNVRRQEHEIDQLRHRLRARIQMLRGDSQFELAGDLASDSGHRDLFVLAALLLVAIGFIALILLLF